MDGKIKVGIIGGGQLGMMTLQEADFNKADYVVLEASEDCPSKPYCQEFIEGSLHDPLKIEALASKVDVLTWEIEHIAVDTLVRLASEGKKIIPYPSVLKLIQDKGTQKDFYIQNNIPTAPYLLVDSDQLTGVNWQDFPGEKVVVKTRTGGYDGKGVAICKKADLAAGDCPFEGSLLLEHFISDVLELAVIVAVDQQLNAITYPSIEMYFNPVSNLVEFLYSPAQVDSYIEDQCRSISKQVVQAFQSPGLFAVELFITPAQEVLVNEIAPRPHNSGHHTIEGCVTSQFAQLNRILLGESLGSTELKQPSAMINVVGPENISGTYQLDNLEHWNNQSDVFIHMYGKTETRPNRKLGHVTVVADTFNALLKRAEQVKEELRIIPS